MEIVKGYMLENYYCHRLDLSTMVSFFNDKEIQRICFDPMIITPSKKIVLVDDEVPSVYTDSFFFSHTLCFSSTYYQEHREEIHATLVSIIQNIHSDSLWIEEVSLLTEDVIQALLDNPSLKKIRLGSSEQPFSLTEELYHRFQEAGKEEVRTDAVVPELQENFDSMLVYNVRRKLVNDLPYQALKQQDKLYFSHPLTDEEIYYLKYVKQDAFLSFSSGDYENIFRCINRLKECNYSGSISLDIKDKNTLNSYLFSSLAVPPYTDNIEVSVDGYTCSFLTYMRSERKLIDMILPVSSLSPFEKYLYIYHFVSQYKAYKENKNDKRSSRDLYQLLDNEYIVCVGYSHLLCDLLNKVGIEAQEYAVSVDVGLDQISLETPVLPDFISGGDPSSTCEVLSESAGHSRTLIHIVDPKYGIDGYYIADPTWDNVMHAFAFNYSLMTHDEFESTDRYNYMDLYGIKELFFIHSLEEFYKKLNVLLDKNPKATILQYLHFFKMFFSKMDVSFYQELLAKNPSLQASTLQCSQEEVQDILLAIGEHILEKTNRIVVGTQFKEGITSLYTNGVWEVPEGETIESQVESIMEYNQQRQEMCFPVRYRIDQNGLEMKMFQAVNKFSMEEMPMQKL